MSCTAPEMSTGGDDVAGAGMQPGGETSGHVEPGEIAGSSSNTSVAAAGEITGVSAADIAALEMELQKTELQRKIEVASLERAEMVSRKTVLELQERKDALEVIRLRLEEEKLLEEERLLAKGKRLRDPDELEEASMPFPPEHDRRREIHAEPRATGDDFESRFASARREFRELRSKVEMGAAAPSEADKSDAGSTSFAAYGKKRQSDIYAIGTIPLLLRIYNIQIYIRILLGSTHYQRVFGPTSSRHLELSVCASAGDIPSQEVVCVYIYTHT